MMMRTVLVLGLLLTMNAAATASWEDWNPRADERAVVVEGNARFSVLTPELIRLEWSPTATFEDRASHVFVNRRLPVPTFETNREGGTLTITTDKLTLQYSGGGARFDKDNLSISLRVSGDEITWRPGTPDTGNLRGTYRTLDGVSGGRPIPPGIVSRDGWVVVNDSKRLLFGDVEEAEWPWVVVREQANVIDWYFFGYGHDYRRAVHDYTKVAGRIPLPPRYAFGAWWSRYWAYTDTELKQLVRDYRKHDVPLDVLVVDMDWHLEGWTGYTWNPKYFPDPEAFLEWVKDQGLMVTLNLHPHSGVGRHEAAFEKVARHMGLDPEKVERVPFDCTDPRYVEAYFKYLHHPLERQGVDFWWIDWQQGTSLPHGEVPEVDPLFWLNYLHWTDMERNPERNVALADGSEERERPMMFSRWGGLGSHRYQIGFSGDTHCNWESLAFQPYFTSTAANVAYPFWSHDIGGHMPGPVGPELYTRWVQWGIINPILRTHTGKNPLAERRIWKFPERNFQIMREAFHLRYAMVPYIYTAARKAYDSATPLCQPLYYEWPELDEAYRSKDTYLLGDALYCAPVLGPVNEISECAAREVWVPPGIWRYWPTGATYEGPTDVTLHVPLHEIPVFVRSGAIVAMQPKMLRTSARPADPLILEIWPGPGGETRIYEDDGMTIGYQEGKCAWTPVKHAFEGGVRRVTVEPVEGSFPGMQTERRYEIRLRDVALPEAVRLNEEDLDRVPSGEPGWWYDAETLTAHVLLRHRPVREQAVVDIAWADRTDGATRALRRGLRGRLALLDEVIARVGPAGAKARNTLERLRKQLEEDPRWADEPAEQEAERCWKNLLVEIAESDLEREEKTWALTRLLGLQADFTATAESDDSIKARLRLRMDPPLGEIRRAGGAFELAPPPHWRVEGPSTKPLGAFEAGESASAETTFEAVGRPQTTRLQADLRLEIDEVKLAVPFDRALLPGIGYWWVIGPFHGDFHTPSLNLVFPPEKETDLTAKYVGKRDKKVGWQKVERRLEPGRELTAEFGVDFVKALGQLDHAVAYALTYLKAPRDMEVTLAIGTDDGLAVWLNDEEIHRHHVARPYSPKQERIPLRLKKGTNKLLVKVNQWGLGWMLAAHVETANGEPVPEVTAHLSPEQDR